MHCPLLANRKTRWSIVIAFGLLGHRKMPFYYAPTILLIGQGGSILLVTLLYDLLPHHFWYC